MPSYFTTGSSSEIVTSDEGSGGQSSSGALGTPAPLTIFGKSSRLRRSSLLTHNHRGSLYLLLNATDEGLNHLVSLQFGWRRTCKSVYSHSSRNEELTCCLSRILNQHSVVYLTLSWASCPGVQKQSQLRVLSVESKRLSRVQRAICQKGKNNGPCFHRWPSGGRTLSCRQPQKHPKNDEVDLIWLDQNPLASNNDLR